jgi:23S rRNA pseudouridine1911/1915/1917 synthase
VIGDRTYGDFTNLPSTLRDAADKFGRQALHAYTLGFEHPISKEKLVFVAPLPNDFEALIRIFRGTV